MVLPNPGGSPETFNISVTVTDGANPIQGVSVTLTDSSDSTKTYSNGSTGTGSAGGSVISGVPAGTYIITASKEGYENYTSTDNLVVDGDETVNIILTPS